MSAPNDYRALFNRSSPSATFKRPRPLFGWPSTAYTESDVEEHAQRVLQRRRAVAHALGRTFLTPFERYWAGVNARLAALVDADPDDLP